MRIKSILLAVLIAVGFAACNNEEAPDVMQKGEATISVKVVPASNGSTRAIDLSGDGALTSLGLEAEREIKLLEVYVFNAITNALDGYGNSTSDEVTGIETSPGNKKLVVVANAVQLIGEDDINKYDDLINYDLEDAALVAIGTDGLAMTGESDVITLNPGDNQYGYDPDTDTNYKPTANQISPKSRLKIQRIHARVAIVDARLELTTDQQTIFTELKNVEVAMFNVPKDSELFGSPGSLAINDNFLYGKGWPSSASSYVKNEGTANDVFLEETISFPIDAASKVPYFYVTENTAGTAIADKDDEDNSITSNGQMLIVLRGKPHNGTSFVESEGLYTTGGYTYYPVWVNGSGYTYTAEEGIPTGDNKVYRNTQYNIHLKITGIGNPTIDDVEDAFLDVLVVAEEWKDVKQVVNW